MTPPLLPPPQYDFPPTIPVLEHVLSPQEVQKLCGKMLGPGIWYGCAWLIKDSICVVIRIKDSDVARHENGHCNGWPPDHRMEQPKSSQKK